MRAAQYILILTIFCALWWDVSSVYEGKGHDFGINKAGVYQLKNSTYVIHVEVDSRHILSYYVVDDYGNRILKSVERPSALHKWCILWDNKENLWVNSSDIGSFVWRRDDKNTYKQFNISEKQMPEEITKCMSNHRYAAK